MHQDRGCEAPLIAEPASSAEATGASPAEGDWPVCAALLTGCVRTDGPQGPIGHAGEAEVLAKTCVERREGSAGRVALPRPPEALGLPARAMTAVSTQRQRRWADSSRPGGD